MCVCAFVCMCVWCMLCGVCVWCVWCMCVVCVHVCVVHVCVVCVHVCVCVHFSDVPHLWMVETLESDKMAQTLNDMWSTSEQQRPLRVLVQVNTSGEKGELASPSSLFPLPPPSPPRYGGD